MFFNYKNKNSLKKYSGLIKNFSPFQRNNFNLKKNTINQEKTIDQNTNDKKNTNNSNYYQTSSQFLNYKTLKPFLNKSNNSKTFKSINTNNYIINTLNLSEKKIINNTSLEPQNKTVDFDSNYKKLRKEKEELEKKVSAQKKLIQKLIEENEKLDNRFTEVYEENIKLRNVLASYKDTQEQLIILIKLVQKTGVDVESIIDKWNNEVENEENNSEIIVQNKDFSYISDKDNIKDKIDHSFTPITINENKPTNVTKVSNIPKLNFSNLNNRIQYNQFKNEIKENEEGKIKNNKRNLSQGDLNIIKDKNTENQTLNKKMETINVKKRSSPKKIIIKNK
jgi:hypothetical protein